MLRRLLLICVLSIAGVGCASAPNDETKPNPAPDGREEPRLQNLSLRRVGGVAAFDDRIMINASGEVVTSGRALGMRHGQLSDEQMAQVAQLFSGFEKLDSAYPPPEGTRDDLQYQLTYGAKVVRASSANQKLPAQFRGIVQYLEQLASALPAK